LEDLETEIGETTGHEGIGWDVGPGKGMSVRIRHTKSRPMERKKGRHDGLEEEQLGVTQKEAKGREEEGTKLMGKISQKRVY